MKIVNRSCLEESDDLIENNLKRYSKIYRMNLKRKQNIILVG